MTVLPGDTAWTTVTSSSLAPALVLGGALEIGRGAWGVSAEYRSEHTRSHLTSASYRPTYPGLSTFLILDRNVRQVHGALSVVRRIPMPQWGVGVAPSLGWQETRTHWSGVRYSAVARPVRYDSRGPLLALSVERTMRRHLALETRLASAVTRLDARTFSQDLQASTIQLTHLSPHWMILTSLEVGASLRL